MSAHSPERSETTRSRRALHALRSQVRPGSFPLLLAAMTLLYLVNALAVSSTFGSILSQLARLGVLVAAMYVLSVNRLAKRLSMLFAAVILGFDILFRAVNPGVNLTNVDAAVVAFLGWILVVVLREVFRPTTADRDAVVGALCGFLLILAIFTRVHGLVEGLEPGAYSASDKTTLADGSTLAIATFQYFSTVTMTTVGFGDIVPVSTVARLATGLQAILGQLYIAVVIATLVGRVAGRQR